MKKVLGKGNILYVNRGDLKIYDCLLTFKTSPNKREDPNKQLDRGKSLTTGWVGKTIL